MNEEPGRNRPLPVIFNPTAGGGRAARLRGEFERAANGLGVSLDWRPTQAAGHAEELAADAAQQGHPLVLAFGGDGTYNEVARGLVGGETALGVVPAGTTSVLAYEFGVPRPVGRSLKPLIEGRNRRMRVGRTNRGDLVLMMVSAGPDSLVLQRLAPWLKPLGGRFGVAAQAVLEILRPGPMPGLRIVSGGRARECGWVIVGKSRCYAGPYRACPEADPFSDVLQAVINTGRSKRSAAAFCVGLFRGRHLRRPGVETVTGERFRIEAADPSFDLAYQVDGDIAGPLPVEVSIDPQILTVRIPHDGSSVLQCDGERTI